MSFNVNILSFRKNNRLATSYTLDPIPSLDSISCDRAPWRHQGLLGQRLLEQQRNRISRVRIVPRTEKIRPGRVHLMQQFKRSYIIKISAA